MKVSSGSAPLAGCSHFDVLNADRLIQGLLVKSLDICEGLTVGLLNGTHPPLHLLVAKGLLAC